jgi:hypothetical protein
MAILGASPNTWDKSPWEARSGIFDQGLGRRQLVKQAMPVRVTAREQGIVQVDDGLRLEITARIPGVRLDQIPTEVKTDPPQELSDGAGARAVHADHEQTGFGLFSGS